MIIKIAVFWYVAPCRSCVNRYFEENIASIFRVEESVSEEPAWADGCRLSHKSKTAVAVAWTSEECASDSSTWQSSTIFGYTQEETRSILYFFAYRFIIDMKLNLYTSAPNSFALNALLDPLCLLPCAQTPASHLNFRSYVTEPMLYICYYWRYQ
jgi:hypothetical protein